MSASAHNRRPDGTLVAAATAGRKKRPRPLPHVNARNLAIEKRRREQMNGNFLDLAYLVPSIANTQRLTKVHIVHQTIEYLREQRELCASAARDMQELVAENYRLVALVNVLRSALPAGTPQDATPGMTMTATTALAEEPAQVLPVPGTLSRLLNACSLGHGTATLRDANEGPEPRCKVVSPPPPSTVQGPAMPTQQSSTLPTMRKDELVLETSNGPSIWNTGFDFSVPASDSQQLRQQQSPWPLSASSLGPDIFSVVPPANLPLSPGIGFPDPLLAHFSYPIEPLPDAGLHTTSLDHDGIGNPWPGLGIC